MNFLRKYNTLLVTGTTAIKIPIIKRGVVDFAASGDWTPASGDVKCWVDGTAANITNLPTAINSGNCTHWEFVLTAAELSAKTVVVTVTDSATKAVEDQHFIVETYGHASAMYQADLSAANLPANVTQLLGTAWLTPGTAGTPDVNVKLISSDATAADNAESFFDGTGYAGTNNVIPTVTTLTGHTPQTADHTANISAVKTKTDQLTFGTANRVNVQVYGMEANVITAAATHSDFTTEIQTGLATAASIAALNNLSSAQAQTAAQAALEANHLDHLLAVADPGGAVANNSFWAKLHSKSVTAAYSSYDNTTDSLEGLEATIDTGFFDTAASIGALGLYASRTVIRGTVGSATTPSTTQFTPSALSPSGTAADQFKGRICVFDNDTTTAALRGQATDITANSAAALPLFTFSTLTTAPASGDTFSIV